MNFLRATLLNLILASWGCFFVAGAQAKSQGAFWPKLDARASPQCDEALQVAKAIYESDSFYLFAPPELPANFQSTLAIWPSALDISGGHALKVDDAVFDEISETGGTLYWEKVPSSAYRVVVQDTVFNWQGDTFSLYVIDKASSPNDFIADISQNDTTRKLTSIAGDWRPPLVFHEKTSGTIWFIDVGEPYQVLADWNVFVAEPAGSVRRCSVQFRPSGGKAIALLPKPVQRYAGLLDQTVGSGDDEGTLHPTARIRLEVEHTWANTALRPWVTASHYNSREEVEAGLKGWSLQGASYRKIYQEIQRQYPVAEQSLAAYYRRRFNLSTPKAKALAAYMLDMALRSHYVFHRETVARAKDESLEKSPWWNR